MEDLYEEIAESLRDWFKKSKSKDGKPGWVQVVSGKPCARQPGQKSTPKCVSSAKRASMSKKERESAQRRKRAADPGQPKKSGAAKPTYVSTDKKKKKKSKKSKKNEDLYMNLEKIIAEELKTVLNENREKIAQIASELTSGEINEADAIQFLVALGKDREWAKNWVTLVKNNPGMFSEAKKKKKKKKKAKRDACYHKVKSRYKVWPSAYASGALVKCRKVGAKNWGNSKKEHLEIMIEDELAQILIERKQKRGSKKCWDGYKRNYKVPKGAPGSCIKKSKKNIKEEEEKSDLKSKVIKALRDEGGAAGMDALKKHTEASKEEIDKVVDRADNIKVHEDGDIILMDSLEEKIEASLDEKKSPAWQRKAGKSKSGGLNRKGRKSYEKANPGSDLKAPVSKKQAKKSKGGKAAKRRKSFCARMKGMKKKRTSAKTARDPDSRINKALRKWDC